MKTTFSCHSCECRNPHLWQLGDSCIRRNDSNKEFLHSLIRRNDRPSSRKRYNSQLITYNS
ncbi:MAG: hypothetical protein NT007_13660 [Candidatus Kapabacteria bacterium]|nr:hypothetical protein [Candidatus Kapabacteria bacterium]